MRIEDWSSDVCSSDLLTASADLADIRLQSAPGTAPVTAGHLTMELEGQDVAFVEPGTLAVTATGLRWDRLALERIEATAQGTASAAEIGLHARTEERRVWQECVST